MPTMHKLEQKTAETTWKDCFDNIKRKVDRITYETIIKNVLPVVKDSNTLELTLQKAWQRDQLKKYMEPITDIFREKVGFMVNIELSIRQGEETLKYDDYETADCNFNEPNKTLIKGYCEATAEKPIPLEYADSDKSLDPRYTFENFIVGSGNRFAAAAAQAVAEAPAGAYNPLFIYGGSGQGKTHLINAIGHMVMQRNPDARVVYVSSEKFMNDMIESISEKKMKQFRQKYRYVNVLLIDDIQFIKNKESTQEEFFHTFNELHGGKSQIVITSDRPPKDIPTLEDRLRSRFEWGLIADISPPDFETRIAILKKKAERDNIGIPVEVISFIAENITSNIRELEGAFNQIVCHTSFIKQPISLDLAKSVLKGIIPDSRPKNINIPSVQETVCKYYDIRLDEMLGSRRDQKLVTPRQMAMYISKETIGASYPEIGRAFGGRDHTTIMHAFKKVTKLLREASVKNDLNNIKNMLKINCE
jgi:chromosomal replication initiator protein